MSNTLEQMDVRGESILATVGVLSFLNHKAKWRESIAKSSVKLSKTIYDKCYIFLTQEKWQKINIEMPEYSFLDINDAVIKAANDIADVESMLSGIEDIEVASSAGLALGKAISYLKQQMPKLPVSISSRRVRVSDLEVSRFNRVFRTVNNPMTVLDDMLSGCLSRMQVKTLIEVYPTLYQLVVEQFNLAAVNITSKSPDFWVSYPKMKQISVLMLSSTVSESLGEVLQANFSKGNEETSSGGPSLGGSTIKSELLSSSQKVEFK